MQVHCPRCQAKVLADDLDLSSLLAKCRGCHSVFSFRDQLGADDPALAAAAPAKPRPPLPERFVLEEQGSDFVVHWRWWRPALIGLIVFACFWDGFLLFWYGIAFSTDSPLIMKVFPLLHVAVGVGITWYLVASICNRTHVSVVGGKLSVAHSPVPWFGNREIAPGGLKQLYVSERTGRTNNRVTYSYDVMAVLDGGKEVALLRGFDSPDQALWLERRIEEGLGIADRKMGNEYRAA